MEFIYFLSFIPPSKANRVKINTRAFSKSGKRFIIPKSVGLKINKAIWELQKQQEKYNFIFDTPVEVEITFFLKSKRRRDLDNIMKTLGDCMMYANILKDDNLIYKQTLEKIYTKEEGVIIKIKDYEKNDNYDLERLKNFKEWING